MAARSIGSNKLIWYIHTRIRTRSLFIKDINTWIIPERNDYLEDHAAYIMQTIIDFLKGGTVTYSGGEYEVKENSDEGDRILYYVTCLLNCNVWCKPDDGNNEELL